MRSVATRDTRSGKCCISFAAAIALGALVAVLGALPAPYWLIAPGSAVDLRSSVRLSGYPASPNRFFLTDVYVQRASWLLLPARYVPGVKLVRQEELMPKGMQPTVYDSMLMQAMDQSQETAALIAERAAGLHVPEPPAHVYVLQIMPISAAKGVLHVGDMLISVAGHSVTGSSDVIKSIERLAAGVPVSLVFRHEGRLEQARVPTVRTPLGTRLGVVLQVRPEKPALPVPVHFSLENISGSSGGLMLALQVYATLHPDLRHADRLVAGTGTLAEDGSVGPIEGTEQKLIAAKRVGASIFLVPRGNYAEVAKEQGIRVIPIASFKEALGVLGLAGSPGKGSARK